MFRKNRKENEQLDRLGKLVLQAARADEKDIEAASTPFLFTRIRARIADGQRGDEAGGWQSLPLIARRAVPAMALVATLAGGLMMWTSQSTNTNTAGAPTAGFGIYEADLTDTTDPGVEQAILSRNSLSSDEVLGIVVERAEREKK